MTWSLAIELLKRTKEEGMRRNQVTLVAGCFWTHAKRKRGKRQNEKQGSITKVKRRALVFL
jgi:hypothetical protein